MRKGAGTLPSGRFVLVVGILIIVALGAFAAFRMLRVPEYVVDTGAQPTPSHTVAAGINTDTDGDGLPDWEEALWKTNPEETDTDGDGTSDGEEVRGRRNPLVAGPDDELAEDSAVHTTAGVTNTTFDRVSRALFSGYINLKTQTGEVDPATAQVFTQTFAQNALLSLEPAQRRTTQDLKLTPDTSATALRSYGNRVALLLIGSSDSEEKEGELAVLLDLAESEDVTQLTRFTIVASRYEAVANELTELSVPQTLAEEHLALVNALSALTADLRGLAEAPEDPFVALAALARYQDNSRALVAASQAIGQALRSDGVVFASSEPGIIFES